ncbi:unnamed protein product [Rotaria sp. Silwood2]|nr:unnamed protein product [Rotaria sp. Silwood2]
MHNHDIQMGRLITEIIYVYSKLMIIDDRSLVGNRDSEFCIIINDLEEEDGRFNKEAVLMTFNAYAKFYATKSRSQKNDEFAFISYMDEPNSFSVVSKKRLAHVDTFGKGTIRERNKTYRIIGERTDLDEHKTYTTLTACSFDEPDKNINYSQVSSDDDIGEDYDPDEASCDEQLENLKPGDRSYSKSIDNRKLIHKSKKRSISTLCRDPSAKRSRISLSSSIKELNHNLIQLRKQIAGLSQSDDKQQKVLNSISTDQKRIAKAMRAHKIPIVLSEESESQTATSTTNSDSIIFKFPTGEEVDLLKISANKTNPNKFVLKAIDQLFKEEKQLIDIDSRDIDTDSRVTIIRDAVQAKFGLTAEELATVWGPMLECIKSKRRNLKAKIRKNIIQRDNNNLLNNVQHQSTNSYLSTQHNPNT